MAPGSAPGVPADVQMSAADVAYVVNWEKQTGITLNLAFNGIGACTAPSAADESSANCTGTYHRQRDHLHRPRPGRRLRATPTTPGWSTPCWPTRPTSTGSPTPGRTCSWVARLVAAGPHPVTANGSGGTFTAGSYSYEVTAATAYGESEPSTPRARRVAANGSVALTWPEATNGTGTDGPRGHARPRGGQPHRRHGLLGLQRLPGEPRLHDLRPGRPGARGPRGDPSTTYSFTDTGHHPRCGADSEPGLPDRHQPRHRLLRRGPAAGCRPRSTTADASIEQEIGLDQAFAAANG